MRTLVAAAVALLLFAGCTAGDEASSESTTTTAEGATTTLDPVEVAKAPGVTDDAIKLGITYVDLEAISEVTNISHGDYEAAFNALIDDLNQRGGINGRSVEPVYAPINPIGTDAADEACLKLTEDDEVFAITGFFLGDAVLCPLENHDTAVIGGDMDPQRLERAKAPWFTLEPGSDLQADGVKAFDDANLLEGKLAVYAIVNDKTLMNDTILPLLDELGVEAVSTGILDVPPEDTAAAIAQSAVIAEKFKSDGATKVLVVGNGGVSWAQGLEGIDYRPENLFVTTNTILSYALDAGGRDLSVLDGAKAADLYGPKPKQFDEPDMKKCLAVLEDAGYEVGDPTGSVEGEPDGTAELTACRYMSLFEQLATEAGKDLNYATFRAAAESLGEIKLPATPDPYHFGPPPSADGDPAVYIYDWNADDKIFELAEN